MSDSDRRKINYEYIYQRGKLKGMSVKEMLLSGYKVESSGCWRWLRGFNPNGYGFFSFKSVDGENIVEAPHRAFAELIGGLDISKGFVLHSCDNKLCVNPNHLRVGTCQENHDDMTKRNRRPLGIRRAFSKLTEAQVLEIRTMSGKLSQKELGTMFGVAQSTITKIVSGQKWKHLPLNP